MPCEILERSERLRVEEEVAEHLEAACFQRGTEHYSLNYNSPGAALGLVCGLDDWNWRDGLSDWKLATIVDVCRGLSSEELAEVLEAALREDCWYCAQCGFENEDGPDQPHACGPECPECHEPYAMSLVCDAIQRGYVDETRGFKNLRLVRLELEKKLK